MRQHCSPRQGGVRRAAGGTENLRTYMTRCHSATTRYCERSPTAHVRRRELTYWKAYSKVRVSLGGKGRMQPGRRKHQSATIIVDRRVRAAGPGASHRQSRRVSEHFRRESRSDVQQTSRAPKPPSKTASTTEGRAAAERNGARTCRSIRHTRHTRHQSRRAAGSSKKQAACSDASSPRQEPALPARCILRRKVRSYWLIAAQVKC